MLLQHRSCQGTCLPEQPQRANPKRSRREGEQMCAGTPTRGCRKAGRVPIAPRGRSRQGSPQPHGAHCATNCCHPHQLPALEGFNFSLTKKKKNPENVIIFLSQHNSHWEPTEEFSSLYLCVLIKHSLERVSFSFFFFMLEISSLSTGGTKGHVNIIHRRH